MEASVETPYVLEDLGIQRRVLGWIDPHSDLIGSTAWPRNTAAGLSAHLTDDQNTIGDTSVEAVVAYLAELAQAGFVAHSEDGTYAMTLAGASAMGGVCYAEEVAAGRLIAQEDGTHIAATVSEPS
jgi:hypothetical protein